MIHKPSPRRSIHSSAQNKDASYSPQNSPKLPARNILKGNSDSERSDISASSDENEDEIAPSPLTPSQKYFDESFYTTRNSFDRSCNSNSDSSYTTRERGNRSPTFFQTESYPTVVKNNTCATKSSPFHIAGLMVIVVAIILAYVATGGTTESENPIRKNCSFDDLKLRFKKEDDYLWQSLQAGAEKSLNDNKAPPAVYLFLHADNLSTRKLIHGIVTQTAFCFDPTLKPINLESKDFTSNEIKKDYGIVVEKYKNEIKEGGVLLIVNLNEIPGEAARALHAICDTYSPIVNRVMIFMTLVVSDEVNAEENEIELAERTLMELWGSKMKRSELDPLITRVTDQVFRLKSG